MAPSKNNIIKILQKTDYIATIYPFWLFVCFFTSWKAVKPQMQPWITECEELRKNQNNIEE